MENICPNCGKEMNPSWIDDKDWDYSKDNYREPDWWICDCGYEISNIHLNFCLHCIVPFSKVLEICIHCSRAPIKPRYPVCDFYKPSIPLVK
jgi:hypothetical protein